MNNKVLSEKVAYDMYGVPRWLTSENLRNGRRRKFRRPFRGPRCLTRIIYNFNNRGKRQDAESHRLCSFHPYVTTICLSNGANEWEKNF